MELNVIKNKISKIFVFISDYIDFKYINLDDYKTEIKAVVTMDEIKKINDILADIHE